MFTLPFLDAGTSILPPLLTWGLSAPPTPQKTVSQDKLELLRLQRGKFIWSEGMLELMVVGSKEDCETSIQLHSEQNQFYGQSFRDMVQHLVDCGEIYLKRVVPSTLSHGYSAIGQLLLGIHWKNWNTRISSVHADCKDGKSTWRISSHEIWIVIRLVYEYSYSNN